MNEAVNIGTGGGTSSPPRSPKVLAASDASAVMPLRLGRRFIMFNLLAALLLSWPLLAFGSPSYAQDSAAYYKGGRAAVSFVLEKLERPAAVAPSARPGQGPVSQTTDPETAAKQASGARSVTYSVAAYLLSAPNATLVLLTIAQALAAGLIIVATLGTFGGLATRRTTVALLLLSGATTVATTSAFAVPDIFAGLLIGSMTLLTVAWTRLGLALRLMCTAIAAFAVSAHASHIPLAAGMTMLGLSWIGIRYCYKRRLPRWTWAWVVAPLVLGGLTTLAVNRVAFGETSLASKRYPFALARSVNDGPARWYLEKNCPKLRYAICEVYPHGLPKGGALEFLWGKDGVTERATPQQLDRIRAEEADVVLAAAREYSAYEAGRLTLNIGRQLVGFEPYPFIQTLVLDDTGTPQLETLPEPNEWIIPFITILTAISAAVGTAWLGRAFFVRRSLRPVIALVFLGILGNAVTCAVLSAVANRYQARVVWLIPLFALALQGSSIGKRSNGSAPEDDLVGPAT
jgi:hypothetical protein